MTKLVDLSQTVRDGLVTYRGLPAPYVCDFLSRQASEDTYGQGVTFQIDRIEMVGNTGTYLDSPFHRYAGAKDLAALELDALADLPCVVVRSYAAAPFHAVDAAQFAGIDVAGKAVLVETGWSRHWGSDAYFEGTPFLTRDAALSLRDGGARLAGIDALNIDDVRDGERPVHTILLAAEILICEHLTNLAELPDSGARFFAVPPKFAGVGIFPVRAFARIDD